LNDNEAATSWIQLMSNGHLITPSNELLLAAKYMEDEFKKLHGNNINRSSNIMEQLFNTVKKLHCLPDEVIKCLVRTRTFIRFNALNKAIEHDMPKNIEKNNKIRKFMV